MRIEIIGPYTEGPLLPLPLYLARVPAGFPSPADDYVDRVLDLNELVVANPPATYFVRTSGDSMLGAGIHDGDVLVVDRSREPDSGDVVVAALDGQLTVKRIRLKRWKGGQIQELWLVPEHEAYPLIEVTEEMDFEVWGVVTFVLHPLARPQSAADARAEVQGYGRRRRGHSGDGSLGDGILGDVPRLGD